MRKKEVTSMANTSPQVAEKYLEYYVKSKLRPGLFMLDDLAESINITVFQGYTSNILEKIIENNTVSGVIVKLLRPSGLGNVQQKCYRISI